MYEAPLICKCGLDKARALEIRSSGNSLLAGRSEILYEYMCVHEALSVLKCAIVRRRRQKLFHFPEVLHAINGSLSYILYTYMCLFDPDSFKIY